MVESPHVETGEPVIRLDQVGKRFGDTVALSDLTVSIKAGTTALLGRNGAGKSTLLNLITGVVLPSNGDVRVGGEPAASPAASRLVSRQLEFPGTAGHLNPDRLTRLLSLSSEESERFSANLSRFDVPDRPMRHLSHGNQLKVALSMALARVRPVLLLDEPTSGLDVFALQILNELIEARRSQGHVTVVATHQPTFTPELFDQALVVDLGRALFQGDLADLLMLPVDLPEPATPVARLAAAFEVLLSESDG